MTSKFVTDNSYLHLNVHERILASVAAFMSAMILVNGISQAILPINQSLGHRRCLTIVTSDDAKLIDVAQHIYTAGYVTALHSQSSKFTNVREVIDDIITRSNQIQLEAADDHVMYVDTSDFSNLNVRKHPTSNSESIAKLEHGSEILVIDDLEDSIFAKVKVNDLTGYVNSNFLSANQPMIPNTNQTYTDEYDDSANSDVLNEYAGTVQGPSGKETYYNLPMEEIVKYMHSKGVKGEYWVRNDGVKMLGKYVMVAANLRVHPRGSLVETSLGTGIVCDTGSFAYNNITQLDIATTWH